MPWSQQESKEEPEQNASVSQQEEQSEPKNEPVAQEEKQEDPDAQYANMEIPHAGSLCQRMMPCKIMQRIQQ